MNRKIVSWIFLVPLAILCCLVLKDFIALKTAEATIEEIATNPNKDSFPFGRTYSYYISQGNFDKLSQQQRVLTRNEAFVVNNNDIAQVARLKELKPENLVGENHLDKSPQSPANKIMDTLYDINIQQGTCTGYVNLSENKLLFFALPFSKHWQFTIDVSDVKPIRVNNEKTGIILEQGKHFVRLNYKPRFLQLGILLILLNIVVVAGINWKKLIQPSQEIPPQSNISPSSGKISFVFVAFLLSVPFIIYFYFLRYRTNVIYGDDLAGFQYFKQLHTFRDKINMPISAQKFRPIHGLLMYVLISIFQKNLAAYYVFNICIQTLITYIFAKIVNLFLKSPYLSVFLSLILGLSQFSLFSVTQILNGGALEGLSMFFFLCSLLFIVKILVGSELTSSQKHQNIIRSILFANLSLYTHERYIMLLPFILLFTFLFPTLKSLLPKQKKRICILIFASIFLNIFIKKYIFSIPFFVGTGGTNIDFSFETVFSFFIDAFLSVIQINSGAGSLVGIKFTSLPSDSKILVFSLLGFFLTILLLFLSKIVCTSILKLLIVARIKESKLRKAFIARQQMQGSHFKVFLFLLLLFIFFLVPAIITIRVEQRFLMASFSVFVLIMIMALSKLKFRNIYIKNITLVLFGIIFLMTNYTYLSKGSDSIFFRSGEILTTIFKKSMENGSVRPDINRLFIWEKHRDPNAEIGFNWDLGGGEIFEFYQNKKVQLVYIDSIYTKSGDTVISALPNFDKNTDEIIYYRNEFIDLTNEYLRDSLKSFVKTE